LYRVAKVNEENNWSDIVPQSRRNPQILGKLYAQDRMHAVMIGLKRGIVRV